MDQKDGGIQLAQGTVGRRPRHVCLINLAGKAVFASLEDSREPTRKKYCWWLELRALLKFSKDIETHLK
jgi:hypothetical protein